MSVQTGHLRHRITLRRRDTSARGVWHDRTVTVAKGVERWASIRRLTQREAEQAAQLKLDITHVMEMHWEPNIIGPADYVEFGDRSFEVVSVENYMERGARMVLRVIERARGVV